MSFTVSEDFIKGKGLHSPGPICLTRHGHTQNLLVKPHFWSCPESGTKSVPGLGALSL